ncbi:excisionase family DNA-binding protein [Nocardia sp. NBC_01503]|uniref:excisionase family DNA-binding protein n=1 Tax=Nocardia sp. NBC_01503 TaxID=2975997 RepID=UPI002E7B3E5E|nr:excisionase family DNA-binding protein [Nocardia sp. NBC_01503]WTL29243.1 excisionase family DNA-binding protein [Nocardia sp. NBC_01503]
MAETLNERTLLPEHPDQLATLQRFLDAMPDTVEASIVRSSEGDVVALPAEVVEALRLVAQALSEGKAVTVAPLHTTLTTQEAAELLGMSRPTFVKLLDSGAIPFTRPGRHRRVRLTDVLAFREFRRAERAAGLSELTRISEDLGLYDDVPDEPLRRD